MHRRAFLCSTLLLSLPLRACANLGASIRDLPKDRRVDQAGLFEALRAARYRLLGEVHDNPEHHAIRARLLDELGRAGLKPRVAFEQFDARHDSSLQATLRKKDATPEEVAEAVRFDRKGWNWDFYRPIVEAALRHGMALRAAAGRAEFAPWPAERERRLGELIYEGHCRAIPRPALARMVAAQRARDAKLAEALRDPPQDGAVLIAGNGHVRKDLGVPLYLGAPSLSVGFVEEPEGDDLPYDFAWITSRATRPDPCEAFRRK